MAGSGVSVLDALARGPVVDSMEASSTELMSRMVAGDHSAFETIYDRYAPRVFGLLMKILGHRGEAEDVLQETFWQLWSRVSDYEAGRASPHVWLVQIARSRAIDRLRRRRNHEALALDSELPSREDACGVVDRLEAAKVARKTLVRLPEEQRTAIGLAFFCGMTHEEIARQQCLPLGTVKTRIRRGMQRLRELLNETPTDAVK